MWQEQIFKKGSGGKERCLFLLTSFLLRLSLDGLLLGKKNPQIKITLRSCVDDNSIYLYLEIKQ